METSLRLPLLDERQAAAFLSVSPRTLQSWRVRGCGPSFVLVGARIRYCPTAIERWLKVRRATVAAPRKPRPVTLAHRPVLSPRMVELITNELKRGTAGEIYLGATAYRRLLQVLEPNAATFARVLGREVTVGAGGTIRLIIPRNSGFTDAHLDPKKDTVAVEYDPRSGRWISDIAAGASGFDGLCGHVWRVRGRRGGMAARDLFAHIGAAYLALLAEGKTA